MKFERLEGSQVKAFFTVKNEVKEAALDKAFEVKNAQATIKGFRKGHAPKAKFLAQYGVESLYAEALDIITNDIIRTEIVTSKEFRIVAAPELDLDFEKLATTEDFEISLTFDVLPTITLGKYKGIEVKKANPVVTEDDVTARIKQMTADKLEVVVKANQVIEEGDLAIFDFEGSVDGVKFDGGTAQNYELVIGSKQFIPGFEDQMIGMKANEEKDLNVTFPEEYGQPNLAGKAAVFKVKVHEVKQYAELSDEVVATLNIENVKTVSEYKTHIEGILKTEKEKAENNRVEEDIMNTLIKNTEIDVPKSFIKNRADQLKASVENQAKQYNIPFEMFLQFSGMTVEAFETQTNERALNDVKFELIMSEIIKVEKLDPSEAEVNEAVEKHAKATNTTAAAVISKFGVDNFKFNIQMTKAIELVKNSAIKQ